MSESIYVDQSNLLSEAFFWFKFSIFEVTLHAVCLLRKWKKRVLNFRFCCHWFLIHEIHRCRFVKALLVSWLGASTFFFHPLYSIK
jgi:hypothetical protein